MSVKALLVAAITLVVWLGCATPTLEPTSPPSTTGGLEACHLATPGASVTCRVERAYCDYRPDVSGRPTFCNSPRPFPNHEFTLLFWQEDRSDLDGECLVLTGFVSLFEGTRQITSDDLDELRKC